MRNGCRWFGLASFTPVIWHEENVALNGCLPHSEEASGAGRNLGSGPAELQLTHTRTPQ